MAFVFSLAIECGDEAAARACADHFAAGDVAGDVSVRRSSE